MIEIIKLENIQKLIFEIRGQKVIIDSDVAGVYNVETRDINKAVKNNPDKFPAGYIFELTKDELDILRGKFSTTKFSKTRVFPKAFTEKGLYMLATILRSKTATNTTLAIIETFARIRELSRNVKALAEVKESEEKKGIMKRSGAILTSIVEDDLQITDTETSVEFNLAVVKLKHTVKRGKRGSQR